MDLPSLRTILTRLLKDLEIEQQPVEEEDRKEIVAENPPLSATSLPQRVQSALVALHQIFPALLLSSLDLLDNSLATRYVLDSESSDPSQSSPPIYYVRSSQTRSSRTAQHTRSVYEVRPTAWHCTCPSFTFSAFSSRNAFDPFERGEDDGPDSERWGGEMRGGQIGICKHLLAVVIGERLKVIPKKEVDRHTLAGYAYGDA